MLSKEDIEELKAIYSKEYGRTISDDDAYEMGIRLVNLFRAVYRPIPKDNHDD